MKICGLTDAAGIHAAVRSGADAIGLNVVDGTPRALSVEEAAHLATIARTVGQPRIVLVTADASDDLLDEAVRAVDPDAIQYSGTEPASRVVGSRPAWRTLHVRAGGSADEAVATGRELLGRGVERLLVDTAGGPHPGGPAFARTPRSPSISPELPVLLAGGLTGQRRPGGARHPGRRRRCQLRCRGATNGGHPSAQGSRQGRAVREARQGGRDDRPNLAFGPTPVHAGLLDTDGAGRWGMERDFGGRYVPETLMAALVQLETAYDALRQDPVFWADLRELLQRYAGRPTPLYRADRLATAVQAEASRLGGRAPVPGVRLYLKREDLAHTGAHKINNALGQALLTRRLGKSRVIAETGAGQHGVATATACALLDLPCVVYMGAEDIERQRPNVLRMRALGAEVRSVTSGTATLKDAVNEAMRDWVTNVETTHYVLGSAMGPHPYPTIVRDLQRRIGDESAAQLQAIEGRLPDMAPVSAVARTRSSSRVSSANGSRSPRPPATGS